MSEVIAFGYGRNRAEMQLKRLNRHGIIAGATGTGKTVTLKVLAEQLSDAGIPVFLSDIKGDLNSLVQANRKEIDPSRLEKTQYLDYTPTSYPVELWDVFGENGTPVRMTISELGPVLLTRLLGLNDTQESILNIVFSVADERGLLLIDLMDLRAMLNFVADNAAELSQYYGNIPSRSIGAILRSLVVLEQQGGKIFFGEPSLEIADLMRTTTDGRGVINVLQATELFNQPTLYSTVLLSLLSELYEVLPEVGDLDKPKMVFFFDEAHILFKDAPKVLLEKVELIVRLIRSKGVGIFFVTQNPTDIPDSVASQLGNRIQHGLRAFTPKELKTVTTVAETFRQEGSENLAKVIQELEVGEAVVSTLQTDGTPSFADRVMIYPPKSQLGTVESSLILSAINSSSLMEKYADAVNRESAHEQILAMMQEKEAELIKKAEQAEAEKQAEKAARMEEKAQKETSKTAQKANQSVGRKTDSIMDRFAKNLMSQVGREVGRVVTRGIMGMLKGK
ncbi:helicase HerA-like domain-containing protein [Streptococcus ruminantium]|uniref:helicase HerA-like domain-containing protein n=1 Tax=Streptococcus ruminantium TaxID=1917441 RepID=UPI0012DDC90F|nr:helicase HerA-like domain-containing protein [Streptococcus ruminantium]